MATAFECVVGDTNKYIANPFTLDGTPWSLTGGSATFHMKRPDGIVLEFAASLDGSGVPYYIDSPSSISMPSNWEVWFICTDAAGIHKTTPPWNFTVQAAS